MNRTIIEKLDALQRSLAKERGSWNFVGLLLRDASPGKWDVVVSAPWLHSKNSEDLRWFSRHLTKTLTPDELLSISRIVILPSDDPSLGDIIQDMVEVVDDLPHQYRPVDYTWDLRGIPIRRAIILVVRSTESRAHRKKAIK